MQRFIRDSSSDYTGAASFEAQAISTETVGLLGVVPRNRHIEIYFDLRF